MVCAATLVTMHNPNITTMGDPTLKEKESTMKRLFATFTSALGLALAVTAPAHAVSVILNIDPDGAPGGDPAALTAGLDWAPGNAIIQDIEAGVSGGTSQIYAHSTLSSFIGRPPGTSTGLSNGDYEWTYTLAVNTTGSQVIIPPAGPFPGGVFTQLTSTGGGTNYFEVYYDPTPDANQLAGTGFDDGTLVLAGTILPGGVNTFTAQGAVPSSCGPLDQFGADNYPAIETVCGTGGGTLQILATYVDPNFFVAPPVVPPVLTFNYSTTNNLPFAQVDPSALFDTVAGTGGATTPGATIPSIGDCNGCAFNQDGTPNVAPNVMVQADASTTFQASQPGALLLLGSALGLTSFVHIARRRRS